MARRSREDRRHEIAVAMKKVVAERGVDGASIVEVAKRAKLAPGLVHYCFTDKEELLVELLTMLRDEALERVRVRLAAATTATAEERLHVGLDAYLAVDDRSDQAAVACWVALSAEALRRGPLREPFEKALAELTAQLRGLVAEALPSGAASEADGITAALLSSILGYFTLAATAPATVPPATAAPMLRESASALLAGARVRRRR